MLIGTGLYAQSPSKVDTKMHEIAAKYEETDGVDCIAVVKGEGLELVKLMLRKEFGKSFMKKVTSIVIIDYSSATAPICEALRKDVEPCLAMLEEIDPKDGGEGADNEGMKCYIKSLGANKLSDFLVMLEDKENKTMLYLGGEITFEQ
jgi:hypothetical protein